MKYYTLAGCDGVGKSTLFKFLQNEIDAKFIIEPTIGTKEKLKSCHDPIKRVSIFADDRRQIMNEIFTCPQSTIISDRSYICSLVYQSLEIESELHWTPYESIKFIMDNNPNVYIPNLVIYITCYPSIAVERCNNRHETLTITDAKRIMDRYDFVFQLMNLNVVKIDTSNTTIEDNISKIMSYIQ